MDPSFTHLSHDAFPALQYAIPAEPTFDFQQYNCNTSTAYPNFFFGPALPAVTLESFIDPGTRGIYYGEANTVNDSDSCHTNSPFVGACDVSLWDETLDPRQLMKPSSTEWSLDECSPSLPLSHSPTVRERAAPERPSKIKCGTFISKKASTPDSAEPELVAPPKTINGKSSHSRKVPAGHVRRAPNAFMLFRSDYAAKVGGLHQRDVSRFAGALWREVGSDARHAWKQYADIVREVHEAGRKPSKRVILPKSKVAARQKTVLLPTGETHEDHKTRVNQEADDMARQHIISLRAREIFDEILPPGFKSVDV